MNMYCIVTKSCFRDFAVYCICSIITIMMSRAHQKCHMFYKLVIGIILEGFYLVNLMIFHRFSVLDSPFSFTVCMLNEMFTK